mgnify:CR=1 FL=1
MSGSLDDMAVKVAKGLLMAGGEYCEIVVPPQPLKGGAWQFVKQNPVTKRKFRVTYVEEELT